MDYTKAGIIVAIVLLLVILMNLGLYLVFSRKDNNPGTIELLMRAGRKAKNPWSDEDNALKELSELVETLKQDTQTETASRNDPQEESGFNGDHE